jgi:hypothetical protein
MPRTIDAYTRSTAMRTALALIAALPLAACGAESLSRDPFGDAASTGCGGDQTAWRPGCATARNVAAMADNPRDLDTPRGEAPRDSMRRDALISGYNRSGASGEPRAGGQAAPTSGGRSEP